MCNLLHQEDFLLFSRSAISTSAAIVWIFSSFGLEPATSKCRRSRGGVTPASKTSKIPPLVREVRPGPPHRTPTQSLRSEWQGFCYFEFLIVLLHSRLAGPRVRFPQWDSEARGVWTVIQVCEFNSTMRAHETSISSFRASCDLGAIPSSRPERTYVPALEVV
jgi:hypothetical protein